MNLAKDRRPIDAMGGVDGGLIRATRRRDRVTRALLAIVLAGSLASCSHSKTASTTGSNTTDMDLTHTSWRVEDIGGNGIAQNADATLKFDTGGKVSGGTGCNHFTGGALIDGDKLAFKPLATTRMACSPPLQAQEQAFVQAIGNVRSYLVDPAGKLVLLGEDGKEVMRLKKI
jgi:putative lipoprotein